MADAVIEAVQGGRRSKADGCAIDDVGTNGIAAEGIAENGVAETGRAAVGMAEEHRRKRQGGP